MQKYLRTAAGVLNAIMLIVALLMLTGPTVNLRQGRDILIAVLMVFTPAFTLFALFAPSGD